MTIEGQFQQGDLLVEKREPGPKGKRIAPVGTWLVLADGAVTGNRHVLSAKHAELYEAEPVNPLVMIAVVKKTTSLTHESDPLEHDPVPMAPGEYLIERQEQIVNGLREIVED